MNRELRTTLWPTFLFHWVFIAPAAQPQSDKSARALDLMSEKYNDPLKQKEQTRSSRTDGFAYFFFDGVPA